MPLIHVTLSIYASIIGPAQFETCSGDENMNTLQTGSCSGTEKLLSTVGQSVEFNIALSHQGTMNKYSVWVWVWVSTTVFSHYHLARILTVLRQYCWSVQTLNFL